jgi:hypothetical protein
MNARMSLGRQPPPKPTPALRNLRPIRSSWPSASASCATSAPAALHTSAMALINEILVARKAAAATLTNSAVGKSHTSCCVPEAREPAYGCQAVRHRRRRTGRQPRRRTGWEPPCPGSRSPPEVTPGSRQVGLIRPTAHRTGRRSRSAAALPTGTVDLPTSTPTPASPHPTRPWGQRSQGRSPTSPATLTHDANRLGYTVRFDPIQAA